MPPDVITIGRKTQKELLATCQALIDHLTAYAIAAEKFDEDAFAACERAERLIMDAKLDTFAPGRDCDAALCPDEQ